MSRSGWEKEKHENTANFPENNCDEGTAARTRPFTYDEIMYRRKNKKLSENSKNIVEGEKEAANTLRDSPVENIFGSDKGCRQNKNLSPGTGKQCPEDAGKISSRKKEEDASVRSDGLLKRKDRENNVSGKRLKDEMKKDMNSKHKGTSEKQIHDRGKKEQRTDYSEMVDPEKRSKDLGGRDRLVGRTEKKSEREIKIKYQNGDDEKKREKNATKKHDTATRHVKENLHIKNRKELFKSHYEESSHKRRRSVSHERENRHKRSTSVSPGAHKRTSYHEREQELSSHNLKARSRREQSGMERRRMGNGSNRHHRWHGGSTSGLGGYSPRKRRAEAAVKTPSPTRRTLEKRIAKWDLAPVGEGKLSSGSVSSSFLIPNKKSSTTAYEVISGAPNVSTMSKPPVVPSPGALSIKQNASVDSVQLTEASRPMRRLYVENLPASASDKDVMECLNNFLLSSGVHIPGTQPCISCVIHKEKGQALVEFLTPEDTSAALSFDGSNFSGSVLKIRRPKDFSEVTGEPEKSKAAVTAISDIVKDSPCKIFIGGISKALSSEMFMEIASAFGPLKAYHFQINEDLNGPCAFVEYVEQSVTPKACAGLNGMKLAGQVLTAVQAIPKESSMESSEDQPFYGIPEVARSLLQKPTCVLKLKNLFNLEGFSSLSESEVEETLEDVRLECSRFGTVKSVNVVKYTTRGTHEVTDHMGHKGAGQLMVNDEPNLVRETIEEVADEKLKGASGMEFSSETEENRAVDNIVEGDRTNVDKQVTNRTDDESCEQDVFQPNITKEDFDHESMEAEPSQPKHLDSDITVEDVVRETASETEYQEVPNQSDNIDDNNIQTGALGLEKNLMAEEDTNLEKIDGKSSDAFAKSATNVKTDSDTSEKDDSKEEESKLSKIFEPGCIFVEYRRNEASCIAAHCLHGRSFDDRIVAVEYVDEDLYHAKFPK